MVRLKNRFAPELVDAAYSVGVHLSVAGALGFAISLLFLAYPIYMMQVYDRVVTSHSESSLLLLTLIAALATLTNGALDALRSEILIRGSLRVERRLAKRTVGAIIDTARKLPGEPTGQALRDLDTLRQFFSSPAVLAVLDIPWIPVNVIVVFILHPVAGLFTTGAIVLLIALGVINEIVTGRSMRQSNARGLENYEFTDSAVRNADVVHAMGMFEGLTRKWSVSRDDMLLQQLIASERSAWFTAISRFLRQYLQILSIGIGAFLVIDMGMSVGGMYAIAMLLGRAIQPVDMLINSWRPVLTSFAAFQRLNDLLLAQPPRQATIALPRPKGQISVERLVFSPPDSGKQIISGITFDMRPGAAVALIGPSGAGKSTLARLMVGALQPTSGHCRLDGADVATIDMGQMGQHVGFLPQDIELFAASVRDNITRLAEGDDAKVIEAAKLAGIHELIMRLPQGYHTELKASGGQLSAGQRQRLGLARAVYGMPAFLVLDEPNSNLDLEGEQSLIHCLQHMRANGTTMVLITHRPHLLNIVEDVIVLREGVIEQAGSRDEVLRRLVKVADNTAQAPAPAPAMTQQGA